MRSNPLAIRRLHWLLALLVFGGLQVPAQAGAARTPSKPAATPAASSSGTVFYVAPGGSDAAPGTLKAPFATLARARDAVRALKKAKGLPPGGVRVLLRGGTYRVEKAFELLPEDSGIAAAPVVYAAYPGEKPVISGGRVVSGLKRGADGSYTTALPAAAKRAWPFRELYVGDRRYILARSPNHGQYQVRGAAPQGDAPGPSKSAFRFRPGDLQAWERLSDVNIRLYHSWNSGLYPLKAVDSATHTAVLAGAAVWAIPRHAGQCYVVENHPGALDAPGEWQLDRETGRLSVIPFGDEKIETLPVVAPVAGQLLVARGRPEEGKYVEHVHFRGIAFHHAAWYLPAEGQGDPQADSTLGAALELHGARNCVLEGCEVAHTGHYSIWFTRGCTGNRIVRNHLHDLGGGGVKLGTNAWDDAKLPTRDNVIDNNFIHNGGHQHPGSVGIFLGFTGGNAVTHNEVCDLRYTGISMGWNWSTTRSACRDNRVENNHVHHVMRLLEDGGGIYSLGFAPGTVIRGNHVHDVGSPSMPKGHGIYLDGGSSGVLVENNLVHDIGMACIRLQDGAVCNTIINNICAFAAMGFKHDSVRSNLFQYNVLYLDRGLAIGPDGTPWENYDKIIDYNVYGHPPGKPLKFAGYTFDEWRALKATPDGHLTNPRLDTHSLVADPRFADVNKRDFRLTPDSPAFRVGFTAFDAGKAGLYGDPAWVGLPARYPLPLLDGTEQAFGEGFFQDDFERDNPGDKPGMATCYEAAPGVVAISEERAAAGRRSLKFADAPGLATYHIPHIYYQPNIIRDARCRFTFDLYRGDNAMVWVEWRNTGSYSKAGPSLRIQADGTLLLEQKPTECRVPANTWVHVEMTGAMGRLADGTWGLRISADGRDLFSRQDLPADPEFNAIRWLGIVSYGTDAAEFWVDNVNLEEMQP